MILHPLRGTVDLMACDSRQILKAMLKGFSEALGDEDDEGMEEEGEIVETAEDRAKARRTLLGEYPLGTRRVLPEHRPVGALLRNQSPRSLLRGP